MAVDPGGGGRVWPGLWAPSGEMRMDPEALKAAAEQLEGELNSLLDGAGSPREFNSVTSRTGEWFGGWLTARDMASGYDAAQSAVRDYYQRLTEQLQLAIWTLFDCAGDTESADRIGASGLDAQTANMGTSSAPAGVQEV